MTSMSTQSPARERDRARSGQSCLCTAKSSQLRGQGWQLSKAILEAALGSLPLCVALTSLIDGGAGGTEHRGDGCAHVQLCQRQLVHEIRELMEGNPTGDGHQSLALAWGLGNRAPPRDLTLLPLTLILLSFFWILLDTCSAQYCSRRKSQKMRPTSAFIQAMLAVSSPSWGGTAANSPCREVAP